jgi:hypothetical protein
MTRTQLQHARQWYDRMERAGFDAGEADQLRRIEMTLHRWAERECNGDIERDGDDSNGRPFASHAAWGGMRLAYRIPDRERGALRRLAVLMAHHRGWLAFHQGDPRGCALYLVKRSDIPKDEDIDRYYIRGIAVGY